MECLGPKCVQENPHSISRKNLKVEVIKDLGGFLGLRDEWSAIVQVSSATVFQSFEWQWLWWKYFGEIFQLHILAFKRDARVVGIAPLYLVTYSVFGLPLHRKLRFIGGGVEDRRSQWNLAEFGPSDYLDIIALPGFESEIASGLLTHLEEDRSLSELELDNVPENSLLLGALIPQLKLRGCSYEAMQDHICPRITLPLSVEEYLRTRSQSVRHRLHQARRAYTSEGFYSIQEVSSKPELQVYFQELVRLHQLRWNRLGYPGFFSDERFTQFLEELAQTFLDRGWMCFKIVLMNGSIIAGRLAFRFKDRLYSYVGGLDHRSPGAKRRPGFALLLSIIEEAIRAGTLTIELSRGYEPYKSELMSETRSNWKIVVPNPGEKNRFLVPVYRLLRFFDNTLRRFSFECMVLREHFREHGALLFLFRYIAFRSKKLSEKLLGM